MLPDILLLFYLCTKCALTRLTSVNRLLFQNSSSVPVQKNQALAALSQLSPCSPNPLLTATKQGHSPGWPRDTQQHGTTPQKCSDAHIKVLLFKPRPALWETRESSFTATVVCSRLSLAHSSPRGQNFSPVFSLLLPWTTSKPIIMPYIKKLFIWSSDKFLQKGWGFIHLIDTREDQLQF